MSAPSIEAGSATPGALPVSTTWTDGNRFELLENGEEFFPAVFAAIAAAKREVLIETFILFEDKVGKELHRVLVDTARRGVSIDLTVDGFGSPDLSDTFIKQLTDAGVRMHFYDPQPRILGKRFNIFRRMHRKIVSVDGEVAFIGGINYAEEHLLTYGPKSMQDYATRVQGPLALELHKFAQAQVTAFYKHRPWWPRRFTANLRRRLAAPPDKGKARLIFRDNDMHRDDIEREYRRAIREAKREILIANAYFFPGYRFLKSLQDAARRGVKVRLVLQGNPDMPQVKTWATMLYPALLDAGVEIYEYCQRPLHGKIAVIDDDWSTIGSSNLDPLSLALNLEANVIIRDHDFNRELRRRLDPLLSDHCKRVDARDFAKGSLRLKITNFIAYHATRHFPTWAGWLPAHMPKLHSVEPETAHQAHSASFVAIHNPSESR